MLSSHKEAKHNKTKKFANCPTGCCPSPCRENSLQVAEKQDKEVEDSTPVCYTCLDSPGPALNSGSSRPSPADLVQSNTERSLSNSG